MAREQFANSYSTTLNGAIDASQTTLTLTSATGAPTAPFRIKIGSELMLVGARTTTACSSITRGAEGSTAATHSDLDVITHVLTAAGLLNAPGAMTTTGDIEYLDASGNRARLALGAAGGHVARLNGVLAYDSGTSVPTGATGDRYWRTDLGLEIYYDGTRWLTVNEYAIHMIPFTVFPPYSANGNDLVCASDMAQGGMWVTRFSVTAIVLTTNDGSHYWSFQLASFDTAVTQHNLGSAVNTSALTAGVYGKLTATIGAAVTAGDVALRAVYTKTSTPGNVYANALLHYRLVVT